MDADFFEGHVFYLSLHTSRDPCGTFAVCILRCTFPITNAWCSPAAPANVYELDSGLGESRFLNQF
jgi:hypothetical protein